jgi:hypothetical protein
MRSPGSDLGFATTSFTCRLPSEGGGSSSTLLIRTYQTKDCCIPEGSIIDTHNIVRAPDLISELLLVYCVHDKQLEEVFLVVKNRRQ